MAFSLALLCLLLLPPQVMLGINTANALPKAAGVLIPAGISVIGLCIRKYSGGLYQIKGLLTVLFGNIFAILLLFFNL